MAHTDDKYQEQGLSEAMMFAEKYHRWILEQAQPYLGRQIIEVGAGIGNFAKTIPPDVYQNLHLLEPTPVLFQGLQQQFKHSESVRLYDGDLHAHEHDFQNAGIDTIIYINVLEHIADDMGELRLNWRILESGGKLILFVPALQWLYSNFDRLVGHYRRYMKRELCQKIQDAGFRVVACYYMDALGVLPWYVRNTLMGKPTLDPSAVKLYDTVAVPVVRLMENICRPPVGKNLFLVAEKTTNYTET